MPPHKFKYKRIFGDLREHVVVAEGALGKPLPAGAVVHHVNEDTMDNRPSNLVICQDNTYHHLLHQRLRVLRAGGRPFLDKICFKCRRVLPKATAFSPNAGECKQCAVDRKRKPIKGRAEQAQRMRELWADPEYRAKAKALWARKRSERTEQDVA